MLHDLDLLQGPWRVTTLEIDGQSMPPEMLADASIVIEGNRFTSVGMGGTYRGTLDLDTSTNPRQLNMKFDAGPEKGNTNLCIYEVTEKRWKICIATRGIVRPAKFASSPGSGFAFEMLVRSAGPKAKKAKLPAKKSATRVVSGGSAPTGMEGEWRMVSGVMNGQPMEKSAVKWAKRVTQGNVTTVLAGPQVMMKMEFTSDSSKSPKTIDYLNIAGANKGKEQKGIYELKADLLKVCVAAPGAARPKQFQSEAGDGNTFTVWKRS